MAWRSMRTASRFVLDRRVDLRVEGADFVPETGPAIIAARHYHHLYDGCALMATLPRPPHILVALDWAKNPAVRFAMRHACQAAEWPIVLRTDGPSPPSAREAMNAVRRATRETRGLLRGGQLVVIFPEAYPTIDPGYTPKHDETEFLPFHPGAVRFAASAAREGVVVPIVPAGFSYERGPRWRAILRFGAPMVVNSDLDQRAFLLNLEERVRFLSESE